MQRILGWCLVVVCALAGRGLTDELKSGTMLGADTAEQAKGLLPDEMLGRYRKGEFMNPVVDPKPGTHFMDEEFLAAGESNKGKFIVSEVGTIIDPKTGKQPTYIYGPPFPDIDPKDPQAGVKLVWNFFYQSYTLGDDHNLVALTWVGRRGVDRTSSQNVWQKFFDGQAPSSPHPANPNNLLFQQFVETVKPADLQGTDALTWRYRDTKRDNTWAYVPALRRVRAVSPTNRSDGFLGSDMSQDDGSYFDGKPEDFDFKVVGEGEMLCPFDKASVVDGKYDIRPLPGGGWRGVFPARPRFGFQAADAKVVPWAPLSDRVALVKRPVWFVDAVPRDKYYLYGKLKLRFEKGTYVGCWNSKFDWQGTILNTYEPLHGAYFKVDGGKGPWRSYSEAQHTEAQNFRLDRATVSHPYADDPGTPSDSLIDIPAATFDYQTMMQRGK